MAADIRPPEHLFVYGTLLSWIGHPMGQVLREHAEFFGPAWLRGVLYLVESLPGAGGTERPSFYPALIRSDDPRDIAHGELYAIRDTKVFDTLDRYEACGQDFPEPWEYIRLYLEVETTGHIRVPAWVYVYNRPVSGLKRIEDGRWPAKG